MEMPIKYVNHISMLSFLPLFFFFCPSCIAYGILVSWLGIKSTPPVVEAWSSNHWTSGPLLFFFFTSDLFLSMLKYFFSCPKWNEVKVAQLCPALGDPMEYTVHGILQGRILEWVAFPFSRGSSQPRDRTQVSGIAGGFFAGWATRKARCPRMCTNNQHISTLPVKPNNTIPNNWYCIDFSM